MTEPPMTDLVGRQLGEFILREQIGEGGCAVVYRCEQRALKRDVVVKLHTNGRRNDAARERFLREARLASLLDHPYAAHVYAFGAEDDGLLWIAMELVGGTTLSERLKMHGPMPLEQFVPFFESVAEVVDAAHERGIIHRDLKPSNVMVIERGIRLFPKLLDLGIAKLIHDEEPPAEEQEGARIAGAVTTEPMRPVHRRPPRTRTDHSAKDDGLTRASSRIGSSAYMSPEQWINPRAVGRASDIYSLGVLAYEVLTGRRPFNAASGNEYYHLHVHAEAPPLGDGFTPELDRVLQRALAKDPDARYRTALEFAAELRATLRTQPREQLRSLAQMWNDRARSSAMLLRGQDLRRAPANVAGELERAFIAASRRQAVRIVRIRRFLALCGAAIVCTALWYHGELKAELAEQKARSAEQVAVATFARAELEQGRSALLHNEPEALGHLFEAFRLDHAPSTAFMLARAMQPRLAERARFPSSAGRMWSATFSPDGAQIVTTDDKNAQVWDTQNHRLLFPLPHGDVVYQAVYCSQGTRLVTAAGDGKVRIWDALDGALVRELKHDSQRRYGALATLPDGKLVAAMDLKGEIAHVWDAASGALLAELPNDGAEYFSLSFSADGRWLATSGGDSVRVFDTRTWVQILRLAGKHRLSWDPKKPYLLTGSPDGEVEIWSIPSGKQLRHLRDAGSPVNRVAFSPNGELAVAASADGAELVWDATSGKLRSQGNYLHGKILSIEFDPTSTLVVAAGASGAIAVTDAVQGMPVSMLDGPKNVVMVAHFDPSSRHVLAASWDGTARIWDASAPYRHWTSPPASEDCGRVNSLELDHRFVAVGCKDHPTQVWDTARGQLLAEVPSVTPVDGDFGAAYPAISADGDRVAVARGNTVEVYEVPGGRKLRTIAQGALVHTVAFSKTGRDIVSGGVDGSLLISRDNGALLTLPRSSAGIDVAGFLPDGRVVATDAERHLRAYDLGGTVMAELETVTRVRMLRMSLDGRRLVTISSFIGIAAPPELWDAEHYQLIARLEDQGQGQVYSARFIADGRLITACGDGAVRLWDSRGGEFRQIYRGGSRFLVDAVLWPDGSMIVGGGGDGVLRFWDAASGERLWAMPAHRSQLIGIRVTGNEVITRGYSGDMAKWVLPDPDRVIAACKSPDNCACKDLHNCAQSEL